MSGPGRRHGRRSGFPLTMANPGEPLTVADIRGGRGMRQHLTDMGIAPGVTLTMMNGPGRGVIVKIMGTRIALAPGMARRVMVRKSE